MIGSLLNAAAILIGGIAGLITSKQISNANQGLLKLLLGVFTLYVGLSMTWQGLLGGGWVQVLKQLGIVVLAMTVGNLTGKLFRIQKGLNHLGQYARERMTAATAGGPGRNFNDGFTVCALLFCVAPLATLGAVIDGLTGNIKPLVVKSLMDGLATMTFVKMFGWSAMVSILPVVAYQGSISLLAKWIAPTLAGHLLVNSVVATGGLLVFSVGLVILDLKKIELSDYLPSLAFAPLLAWLMR